MPIIYELIGFPTSDRTDETESQRRRGICPFTKEPCDGGGNRHQSAIDLRDANHRHLAQYFGQSDGLLECGVCSIQLCDGEDPWIVCPRRLFYIGHNQGQSLFDPETRSELIELCDFPVDSTIGVWREVKLTYREGEKAFDYRFDYVLMPLETKAVSVAAIEAGMTERKLVSACSRSGYEIREISGRKCIVDFPSGSPIVIEVMTSSTSGGNQRAGTTVPQSFEDCVMGLPHQAPGVNYRQVWARMASQLIVKSEAALAWGGKTIWVVQDLLSNYISSSTALNLNEFKSENLSEVNIYQLGYGQDGNPITAPGTTIQFNSKQLLSGPIKPNGADGSPSFSDIVCTPVCPPLSALKQLLASKPMVDKFTYVEI